MNLNEDYPEVGIGSRSIIARTLLQVLLVASCLAWPTVVVGSEEENNLPEVPSPFAREGSAVLLSALGDKSEALVWSSDQVIPGKIYSVSFFFQNRTIRDPQKLNVFKIDVIDQDTKIFHQRLYTKNKPQFFTTDVVFSSNEAKVLIETGPGNEIIFGEFGRSVRDDELSTTRFPNSSVLWTPKLQLPEIYRGLRKFQVKVSVWGDTFNDLVSLERVAVRASMNLATAKLPVIMPGSNVLNLRYDEGSNDARLRLAISSRGGTQVPHVHVSHDKVVPADGATFGRVFVTATDEVNGLNSGGYFRLRAPSAVRVHPYTKAISDWSKLQTTREFHLTSLEAGSYELSVDRWDGKTWVETDRTFEVLFEQSESPATAFTRSDYIRRWIEPTVGEAKTKDAFDLDIPLSNKRRAFGVDLGIDSRLSPQLEWEVSGPVKRLGLFNSFQPDPRTLRETAETLKALVTVDSGDPERDYAYGVEEYVGLLMEGVLQEAYPLMDYPSYGRLHREGRGWCWQYSAASHALAIQGGLESRLRNVPHHVMGEVRGAQLSPMLVDSMLQVAVTDAVGNRTILDRVDDEDTQVRGAGVDELTRRGKFSGYLETPLEQNRPWQKRDPTDIVYRNAYLDDEVFSISLLPWENLSWKSGNITEMESYTARGICAENQTIITKTSVIDFARTPENPAILIRGMGRNQFGHLTPEKSTTGQVEFRFETPVEIDDLFITTRGTLGAKGRVAVGIRPDLNPPLVEGLSGIRRR